MLVENRECGLKLLQEIEQKGKAKQRMERWSKEHLLCHRHLRIDWNGEKVVKADIQARSPKPKTQRHANPCVNISFYSHNTNLTRVPCLTSAWLSNVAMYVWQDFAIRELGLETNNILSHKVNFERFKAIAIGHFRYTVLSKAHTSCITIYI